MPVALSTEPADIAERLLNRVSFEDSAFPENGCWLWRGALTDRGYASFRVRRKSYNAHRWLYEWKYGPLPHDIQLDHLCRTRCCINPEHLEPLTPALHALRTPENLGWFKTPSHCEHGHELTPLNTYIWIDPKGTVHRHCRSCKLENWRRWKERQRKR